jgi:hypothetical protein
VHLTQHVERIDKLPLVGRILRRELPADLDGFDRKGESQATSPAIAATAPITKPGLRVYQSNGLSSVSMMCFLRPTMPDLMRRLVPRLLVTGENERIPAASIAGDWPSVGPLMSPGSEVNPWRQCFWFGRTSSSSRDRNSSRAGDAFDLL